MGYYIIVIIISIIEFKQNCLNVHNTLPALKVVNIFSKGYPNFHTANLFIAKCPCNY